METNDPSAYRQYWHQNIDQLLGHSRPKTLDMEQPTMEVTILGHYSEPPSASSQEYLAIGFSPSSIPLKQRWRNNGLSADFIADYLATFFPVSDDDPSSAARRDEIRGAVSYIANELLENAMKFTNEEIENCPISIRLQVKPENVIFYVTNSLFPNHIEGFQAFIETILASDPQDLYIQRLEENAMSEDNSSSGLGLLTMINDYGAKVGWRFESSFNSPEITMVTTCVELTI